MTPAKPITVIHDGDHGGDDFITSILFSVYPDIFNLIGITSVIGNTSAGQAASNALKALHLARRNDVPVIKGSEKPFKIDYRFGDDAFGENGIGRVEFPSGDRTILAGDAVTWMAQTLEESEGPVTICATGPLTNIACLLKDYSHLAPKIQQLVIMGGGTDPAGNIKPYAEFNFYMDPDAADFVLNQKIPTILHCLNTTHSFVYTKDRQEKLKRAVKAEWADKIDAVMRITEELERKSFGSEGAFCHDMQVCAYLAMADNYMTTPVKASVLKDDTAEPGRLTVTPDSESHLRMVTSVKSSERIFDFILNGLSRLS